MPDKSYYREIRFASVGLILSSNRLTGKRDLRGYKPDADREELKEFGLCLQALCEQGIYFNYPSSPNQNSMFPERCHSPGKCTEGIYLALKVEREYMQDRNSPLFGRLNCLGITSLDTLAQALQSADDNSEKYQAIQEVFEKWHDLADEMVAVGLKGLEFHRIPKAICEVLRRFPSRH